METPVPLLDDFAEPMPPQRILFSARGRIPRSVFWRYGVAMPLLLGAYAHAAMAIAGVRDHWLEAAFNVTLLWSALAVSAKRWHDRDKSGWWALLQFIPVIGTVWTLVANGMLRGTTGRNRFGTDPTGHF